MTAAKGFPVFSCRLNNVVVDAEIQLLVDEAVVLGEETVYLIDD
jgi:hypothetical protein